MGDWTQNLCGVSGIHVTPSTKVTFRIWDLEHIYKLFTVCNCGWMRRCRIKTPGIGSWANKLFVHLLEYYTVASLVARRLITCWKGVTDHHQHCCDPNFRVGMFIILKFKICILNIFKMPKIRKLILFKWDVLNCFKLF